VEHDHLRISPKALRREPADWDVSFLNSKGFGGNNATATVAAPHVVMKWLERRHGSAAITGWRRHNDAVVDRAGKWDQAMTEGTAKIVYRFDHEVRSEEHVTIEDETMHIAGLPSISLVD
jgi:acetoacetyl-[acyl-carrier protein] synthase